MTYFQELKGKKVLITGGSKGIGKDAALAFAKLGAKVMITGRNVADLEAAVLELREFQAESYFLSADMQDVQSIYQMVDDTIATLGGLDVLVNNAGINIAKPAFNSRRRIGIACWTPI
ncbi:SDR family NAD(P)-dependent oxidoreductase [Brevibacillus nitrificans]|uniref:SDR family NAD(P)-dependent oxidoreductase n=1 Tax=Brevibacillus nitrificans TaxID=651560 RepID=UPI003F4D6598